MTLPAFIESLLDRRSYPARPHEVRLVQTHISYVFIAGDYVYKIKKPVNFGFLDYSTLDRRKFFCEEELRLNMRLCPSIYLGVVPVVDRDGTYVFEETGEPVEYAVKMVRLEEDRMMDELVARGEVTPRMIERVARVVADFHARAESGASVSKYGDVAAIRFNTDENFSQTENFVDIVLTRRRYEFIKAYTDGFLAAGATFLARRVENGRIREGHGDLHLANICYTDEPCIYDCIEFNERFRCNDVASEIAFLAMDLDFHGRTDLSHVFVDAYVEASGDGEVYQLLDFYKCYRAFVRGKVRSFPLDEEEASYEEKRFDLDEARRYFDLAYRYAGGKVRPVAIVMCGLSGTGKSYVADALAEHLNLVVIRSDVARKHLAGLAPTETRAAGYGAGIYSDEMTERTYRTMVEDAARLMAAGHSVLLDASFLKRRQRSIAVAAARAADARFLLVECSAPEDRVRARLAVREDEAANVSDATWPIYLEQKKHFEPPEEIDEHEHVRVDTSKDLDLSVNSIVEKLAG